MYLRAHQQYKRRFSEYFNAPLALASSLSQNLHRTHSVPHSQLKYSYKQMERESEEWHVFRKIGFPLRLSKSRNSSCEMLLFISTRTHTLTDKHIIHNSYLISLSLFLLWLLLLLLLWLITLLTKTIYFSSYLIISPLSGCRRLMLLLLLNAVVVVHVQRTQGYSFQIGYCEVDDQLPGRSIPQYTLYLTVANEKERLDWIRALRAGK